MLNFIRIMLLCYKCSLKKLQLFIEIPKNKCDRIERRETTEIISPVRIYTGKRKDKCMKTKRFYGEKRKRSSCVSDILRSIISKHVSTENWMAGSGSREQWTIKIFTKLKKYKHTFAYKKWWQCSKVHPNQIRVWCSRVILEIR